MTIPQVGRENGYIVDQQTGLYIPQTYRRGTSLSSASSPAANNHIGKSPITADGYNKGVRLQRDPDNLIVQWPEQGSGLDDIASGAIVDGRVANVGAAPVISPQISALVRRQQDQAATAALTLTGRATPRKKAKDALMRFNDSPLGSTQAVMQMVHDLRTYNRGAPLATVPLHYAVEDWSGYGMEAVPISGLKSQYYLQVDWGKVGTPVPYLPSIFDLEPTGNPIWPYWYYTFIDNKPAWVLLHHTHILPLTPGVTGIPGVGLSSTWICLGILAESILIIDARIEKVANAVTDGIILITGSDEDATDLKADIGTQREQNQAAGYTINKGYTLLTSKAPDAKVVQFQFRQDTGVTFKDRREYEEDVIAAAFSEPLSSLVTRGGVGFGAQAETTADNSGEMGIGALLHWIGTGLGAIYPRLTIAFSRPSDRAKRLMLNDFKTFAEAVRSLPDGTLEPEEVRAMLQRDVIDIPEADEDNGITTAGVEDSTDATDVNGNNGDDNNASDEAATTESAASLDQNIQAALMLAARLNLEVLYDEDDVVITDVDVDTAIELAGDRVDPDFADLLNAVPVED